MSKQFYTVKGMSGGASEYTFNIDLIQSVAMSSRGDEFAVFNMAGIHTLRFKNDAECEQAYTALMRFLDNYKGQ